MNTDKEIKAIAKTLAPHYCYGTFYSLNTVTDKMRSRGQMPACVHLQSSAGSVSTVASAYLIRERRSTRVQVGFADSVRFDQEPEKTLEVVERLLSMCGELVRKMNETGKWENIDSFDYEVLYNTQDANLVLVLASFNATEADGRCFA
jgi:hypothetical protein